jgi:hypothetical protein
LDSLLVGFIVGIDYISFLLVAHYADNIFVHKRKSRVHREMNCLGSDMISPSIKISFSFVLKLGKVPSSLISRLRGRKRHQIVSMTHLLVSLRVSNVKIVSSLFEWKLLDDRSVGPVNSSRQSLKEGKERARENDCVKPEQKQRKEKLCRLIIIYARLASLEQIETVIM